MTLPPSLQQSAGLKRLVDQMSKLHKAHSSLQMKHEQLLDELEQLRAEKERLQDELLIARDIPFKVSVVLIEAYSLLRLWISKCRHWKYQHSSVVDFIFAYHCSLQGNQPMPNWCIRCESCSRRFSILSSRDKPLSPALTMRRCSRWRWAVAYRLPFVYDSRSTEPPSTVKYLASLIFYQYAKPFVSYLYTMLSHCTRLASFPLILYCKLRVWEYLLTRQNLED